MDSIRVIHVNVTFFHSIGVCVGAPGDNLDCVLHFNLFFVYSPQVDLNFCYVAFAALGKVRGRQIDHATDQTQAELNVAVPGAGFRVVSRAEPATDSVETCGRAHSK